MGIDVNSAESCFCCASHYLLYYLCNVENSAAVRGKFYVSRHEPVVAEAATHVLFVEVANVAVDGENHVAGTVC